MKLCKRSIVRRYAGPPSCPAPRPSWYSTRRTGTACHAGNIRPMPFSSSRRQGQHRIFAIQCLESRVLVDAKYRCMLWWVQIEANSISCLTLECWIVGRHIALQPVGLEPMLRPDTRYPHVADPKLGRQLASAPVRRAVGWHSPRGLQNTGFRLWSVSLGNLPAMAAVQPRHPFSGKPLAPGCDKTTATPHGAPHRIPRCPFSQEQNHAGSPRGVGTSSPASRLSAQFHPFMLRQNQCVVHEHNYSLQMGVTIH